MRTSNSADHSSGNTLERLKLMIYLVPVFGTFPAIYGLWRKHGNRKERDLCRLVVTLALSWIMIYGLLSAGSHLAPGLSLRLLVSNALVTTGYTLTNLVLMLRVLRGQSVKLPGFSQLSKRLP